MHDVDADNWVLLLLLFINPTMYFYAHWQGVLLPPNMAFPSASVSGTGRIPFISQMVTVRLQNLRGA